MVYNVEVDMTEKDEKNNNVGNCPICGYFVGIEPTCVRCGARVKRRIAVKTVRWIALTGSVIGLVLLWVAAFMKEPETIKIGDVTETMNNAFVAIQGRVTGIRYDEAKNTLRMTVNDGTGDIKMNAFNKLKKFQEVLGKNMPALKDKVRVTGALNISQAWGITMFLSIPNRIEIVEKYTVEEKPVGKINRKDQGELFWITVEVIDYEQFTTLKGFVMHKFLLADKSGKIPMVLYSNEFESLAEDIRKAITGKWNRFKMMVEVSVYRNEPQVKILDTKNPECIKLVALSNKPGKPAKEASEYIKKVHTDEPVAIDVSKLKKKELKRITDSDIGKIYLIRVQVEGVDLGTEGFYLNLDKSDMELFISYSDEEKIDDFSRLNSGEAVITAAVQVVAEGERLGLRIADFSSLKIN